jgi:predicted nucleic acid-binding protein
MWGGAPYRLLQLGQTGEIEIVTSPALVAELADVLGRSHLTPLIAAQDMSAMALITQGRRGD